MSTTLRMKKLVFLFLFLPFTSPAQDTLHLTMDTNCFCNDASRELQGTFALHATTSFYASSGSRDYYRDTLLFAVNRLPEQYIVLPKKSNMLWDLRLVFTPNDTSQPVTKAPVYPMNIHLNCFFFQQRYPSFLDQMNNHDTLTIQSDYFGVTHEMMTTPIYTLRIIRSKNIYFADFIEQQNRPFRVRPKIEESSPSQRLLLTDEQIQIFRNYEDNFLKQSDAADLGGAHSSNTIQLNGKTVSFMTQRYISLLMWNEFLATVPKE